MNNEDIKQLDLLGVFHYVLGGVTMLFSCFPFLHVFMGLAIVNGKFGESGPNGPPEAFGWIFVIMGSVIILLGWILGICILMVGGKLKKRQSRLFCMIIAGAECMFMPLGTVLGVFTLIALNKDSVKALFVPKLTNRQ